MVDKLFCGIPSGFVHKLRFHGLLQPLLEKELANQALSTVILSQESRDTAWQTALNQAGLTDSTKLLKHIEDTGLSEEDLREKAEFPARLNAYLSEHYLHKAEARFLRRKNELDRVVYSLLRIENPFLARELYLRIGENEANFADLAAEYSQGPEKSTKGVVGPVPINQAHPILAEKLRTSSPGQLHEPFAIENWWLIVRLESYSPASLDDATMHQMALELFEQVIREQASEVSLQLRTISALDDQP